MSEKILCSWPEEVAFRLRSYEDGTVFQFNKCISCAIPIYDVGGYYKSRLALFSKLEDRALYSVETFLYCVPLMRRLLSWLLLLAECRISTLEMKEKGPRILLPVMSSCNFLEEPIPHLLGKICDISNGRAKLASIL